ncbi:MAG: hydrogenobyrinic acid a,c-diamide synthase (glutamine-hydrolyzing) [Euryarchaeota archaeon]|nr:hydrogenobyrinic acid a,c-diamide synthase (glutamine-hydrolyzing) [Euryarchaeota archaeon]
MDVPRIVISGTSSRAGKTVISLGIMRALRNLGYEVQPFKVGPDFIDPSYHHFAAGRKSRNLDSYMMPPEAIRECVARCSRGADIAVIEGTMGLYDSHDAVDAKGSTAEVSRIIASPVVLVANVERISRTAAAFVLGYKLFEPEVMLAGVVLNRVGNPRHAYKARTAVERLAGMRVFGTVPRDESMFIKERHLGLVPAYEREALEVQLERLAEIVSRHIDLEALVEVAEAAPELGDVEPSSLFARREPRVRIAVAMDRAFTFYYQDNLEALECAGAQLLPVDMTRDSRLPAGAEALYIGGGFPEVMAEELERNRSLREEVHTALEEGMPCYAECGGLMYLGRSIVTRDGGEYEMAGYLPFRTVMHRRFQALGYVRCRARVGTPISQPGDELVGHEFHYSEVVPERRLSFAYSVERGKGVDGRHDGILQGNTLASYLHVHVLSHPDMPANFVHTIEKFK